MAKVIQTIVGEQWVRHGNRHPLPDGWELMTDESQQAYMRDLAEKDRAEWFPLAFKVVDEDSDLEDFE